MCIAILNTKKTGRLPQSYIKNSWENNNMGAGLLWTEKNKLNVFKTYDYDDYILKYNQLRDNNDVGNIVLHFRIATSGYDGEHNLHPFLVNDNLGFVHNGVISGLGNKHFSDTYEFNDMLKKFKHNFLNCEMTKYFISEYIGYSKLVFLNSNDKYTIINEGLGKWVDGSWYSNDSYERVNNYKYHGNTKVYDDDIKDDYENEWEMYEDVCLVYDLNPDDETSWEDVLYYMELNRVESLKELHDILMSDF